MVLTSPLNYIFKRPVEEKESQCDFDKKASQHDAEPSPTHIIAQIFSGHLKNKSSYLKDETKRPTSKTLKYISHLVKQ